MSEVLKQIANLQKQNEGMLNSLRSKNISIEFDVTIDENLPENEKLEKYKTVNNSLKELVKMNKPPPAPKEETKIKEESKPKPKPLTKEDDEEDEIKETKPTFSVLTNMEDCKRAFFNKEYSTFQECINKEPYKIYRAQYKYSSDNDGRPDFVARNLLRGFVQMLDDYRKYLMVCFRCILQDVENKKYDYPSYWIVNSNDDLSVIIGNIYDDYEFTLMDTDEMKMGVLLEMEKKENDESVIGESYLH